MSSNKNGGENATSFCACLSPICKPSNSGCELQVLCAQLQTQFQNRIFKILISTASLPLCMHLHKSSRQRSLDWLYLRSRAWPWMFCHWHSHGRMKDLVTSEPQIFPLKSHSRWELWEGIWRAEQKALEGRGRRLFDIILHSKCRWICQAGSKMEKRCLMYHMSSLLSLTHFNYP